MKIATAAYPLDWLDSWAQYEDKLSSWVAQAAGQGADLLVFPEYGSMELATLEGAEVAGDLERSLRAVSDRMPEAGALHARRRPNMGCISWGFGPGVRWRRPSGEPRCVLCAGWPAGPSGQADHDPVRTRALGRGGGWAFDPV